MKRALNLGSLSRIVETVKDVTLVSNMKLI